MQNLKLLIFLIFCNISYAQEWNFIEPEHITPIVSIQTISTEIINGQHATVTGYGTGVVIEKTKTESKDPLFKGWFVGKILTAAHLKGSMTAKFFNEKVSNLGIIKVNEKDDIMLLSSYIPFDVDFIPVGEVHGDRLIVNGLGGQGGKTPSKEIIRSFSAKVVGPHDNLFLDGYVIPGDSGGPILYKNKVVGIVSGGMSWFHDKIQYTWPIRSASHQKILEIIK